MCPVIYLDFQENTTAVADTGGGGGGGGAVFRGSLPRPRPPQHARYHYYIIWVMKSLLYRRFILSADRDETVVSYPDPHSQ